MSYMGKNLMEGEKVLYRSKLHWAVFLTPIICFILSAMLIISTGISNAGPLGVLFFFVSVFTGISSLIAYLTSEFGITNKRVIIKVGFIRRNSLEVLLNKVEEIHVNQSILGRILNFGSITVSGTGGTKDPFRRIAYPLEFRNQVQQQIASAQ